ncbi:hypothetical protein [Mesorhizobium sp. A623]
MLKRQRSPRALPHPVLAKSATTWLYDLLRAIGNLSVVSGDDGAAHTKRMVMLLLHGLRYGASSQKS